jgi:pyruvate formate lyase activating enzyme
MAAADSQFIAEARYYEKQPHRRIQCVLCPRECVIDDRERGYCGVRENRGGVYYTLVHSRVCAANVDPVEKKPLFHFLPGSRAFSIGTAGCNVNCKMCQNWEISQVRPEQGEARYLPPAEVARLANANRCPSIAYTYTEPVIFYEYMIDTARTARPAGVKSVVVSNGYIKREPLEELCRAVDAIKIDLKAFSEKFYREIVSGELKPVLESLVTIRKSGVWNEIVYLVIPTLNDGEPELRALAKWIRGNLGAEVPVHFTRYQPDYLLKDIPPTPTATLDRAKAIADAEGLRFVYVGNVPGHPAEKTRCPNCRRVVIDRNGYQVNAGGISKGRCRNCQQAIPGVWS